jgi:uncharacterized protein
VQSGVKPEPEKPPKMIYLVIAQLSIAIYGGFFGAGAGILMLAALTLFGWKEMNTMNALKSFLGTCFNGIAVLLFIFAGLVAWPQAVLMSIGGSLGGYVLARFARKLPPEIIRWFVSIVAVGMTAYFFING